MCGGDESPYPFQQCVTAKKQRQKPGSRNVGTFFACVVVECVNHLVVVQLALLVCREAA
jgi:hypothetical protein